MDETQVDQIIVPLLAPQIGRLLSYCVSVLGTVGVTIIPASDSAYKIATGIVTALFLLGNELYAHAHAHATARSAFTQGAASAGVTLLPSEVPKVVSGSANAGRAALTDAVTPPAKTPLKPEVDSNGNVTISPNQPTTYK